VPKKAFDAAQDDGLDEGDIEAILEAGDVVADRNPLERGSVKRRGTAVVVEIESDPWTTVITVFSPD